MSRFIALVLSFSLAVFAHAQAGKEPADQLMDAAKWSLLMLRDDDALWAAREAAKAREDFAEAKELAAKLEMYADPARLEKAAAEGDTGAMVRVGDRYMEGKGGKVDREKAMEWYRKAAEAGEARALWRLGAMFARGEGVEKNVADAAACFQAAAKAGDPWAKYSLSAAHLSGQGVERDIKMAGQLLRESAEAGLLQAMRELVWISEQGTSPAAKREAAFWKGRLRMTLERMARLLPDSPHVAMDMANMHLADDQIDKAVEVLTQAGRRIDDATLHEQLADLLLRQNKPDEAIAIVRAQLGKRDNARLRLVLALGLMAKKEHRAALAEVDRVIKQDAGLAVAHYYRGQILNALNERDAAVAAVRRACELVPENASMRLALAGMLERQKKYDDAAKEYEQLAGAGGQRALGYEGMVRVRILQKNWAQAERVLDRAEKEMPKDAHWPSLRAQMWLRREDESKAFAAAKKAAELAPTDNGTQALYLDLLLKQEGGANKVLRESDSAADGPNGWRISVLRGMARAQLKQPDLAGAEFDRAMYLVDVAKDDMAAEVVAVQLAESLGAEAAAGRLGTRKPERWTLALAAAHLEKQDWPAAVETADRLMDMVESEQPEALRQRALWYAAQLYGGAAETLPTLGKAEQAYGKYIEMAGKDPELADAHITALNNLAYLLADHPTTSDPKKALIYSQKAWDLMGTGDGYKPFVADTHGWVLVQLGRLDEGIAVLREAAARGEESAEMSYHLGEAYLRKGQVKEAVAEMEKARALLKKEKRVSPLVGKRIEASIRKAKEKSEGGGRPAKTE